VDCGTACYPPIPQGATYQKSNYVFVSLDVATGVTGLIGRTKMVVMEVAPVGGLTWVQVVPGHRQHVRFIVILSRATGDCGSLVHDPRLEP